MLLDGKPVSFRTPAEALSAGIAMVFQENSLRAVDDGGAEHLFSATRDFSTACAGIYIAAQQFLQSLNFNVDPRALVVVARRREEADGRDCPRGSPARRASSSSTSRPPR